MLDYYVGNKNIRIIDLRSGADYARSHIRSAMNIPYEENMDYGVFPMGEELVLYCQRGTVSLIVGREMAKRGCKVRSVIGGISAYRGRNLVFSGDS
ncbi:MAG: rhodanese-like domain-containing protein [Lachnospiraceae bacterium]|nr:rhodanese-like domain-containing protein [Lachnospiraceae bacterium]